TPTVVTSSYWDTGATGTLNTGADAHQQASYVGFDFTVWGIGPNINNGYPYLLVNPPPLVLSLVSFPLLNHTPYTAPIVTVFDHSMNTASNSGIVGLYNCDGMVLAFTGDAAIGAFTHGKYNSFGKNPGDTTCSHGLGYANGSTKKTSEPFTLAGVNYTGI